MTVRSRLANPLLSSLTVAGLLGLAGCDPELDPSANSSASDEDADEFRSETGCEIRRQIARAKPTETCDSIGPWVGSQLFDDASGEMGRYCVFEWNLVEDPTPLQVNALGGKMEDYDPDCEVVFGQGAPDSDPLSAALAPLLITRFHESIDWTSAAELDLDEADRSAVHVAVVDTVPFSNPADPRSDHGAIMAKIIKDIACPDPNAPDCAVSVTHEAGLPRYAGGLSDPFIRGGFFGSKKDLAQAIYSAVERNDALGGGPLIINLSVGWEGAVFGDDPTTEVPVKTVEIALEHAACRNALIVSAAGNDGGLCTTGALSPGGWEERLRPTPTRCAQLGVTNTQFPNSTYLPLVYSIGGLNLTRTTWMPGTREGGIPRLVVPASHVVVDSANPTRALTGTSMATSTVVGLAALIWSYDDSLTAAEVMDLIYQSGDPVPYTADYNAMTPQSKTVHALNVCKAMEAVCAGMSSCTMALSCGEAPTVSPATFAAEVATVAPNNPKSLAFNPSPTCDPVCGEIPVAYSADATQLDGCPAEVPEVYFTEPQPTQPACPNCTITKGGQLSMSLDPEFDDYEPTNVTVSVTDATGIQVYRLGDVDVDSQSIAEFTITPMPISPLKASIAIEFDGLRVQDNPLILLP